MSLEEMGTNADPRDTRIVCDCGASLSLEWRAPLDRDRDPKTCDAPQGLRLLTRSATNTYFPQVARVVSLPRRVF
jgi:hypothetical protein